MLLPAHRFLDPRTFTAVIAEAARKKGVVVREETPASGLIWSGKKVVGVLSGAEKIAGGIVINACGAWAGRVDEQLPMRIRPVHGQILSVQGPKGGLRHNIQKRGSGGYITPRTDGRVLVGATNEEFGYEKKVTPEGLRRLSGLVHDVMPHLAEHRVLDSWSGLRPGSPDGLPAVGPDPRAEAGYLWAAGHGASGMMQNPATAKVVTDLVMNRAPRIPVAVGQTRAAGRVAATNGRSISSHGSASGLPPSTPTRLSCKLLGSGSSRPVATPDVTAAPAERFQASCCLVRSSATSSWWPPSLVKHASSTMSPHGHGPAADTAALMMAQHVHGPQCGRRLLPS